MVGEDGLCRRVVRGIARKLKLDFNAFLIWKRITMLFKIEYPYLVIQPSGNTDSSQIRIFAPQVALYFLKINFLINKMQRIIVPTLLFVRTK